MRRVHAGCCPNNVGRAYIENPKSDKAKIRNLEARNKEVEGALNLILTHTNSIDLPKAFAHGLKVMGREAYYGN